MPSVTVYKIMRWIRENGIDLDYDTFDLEDRDVDDILRELGIYTILTDDEKQLLHKEFYRICLQNQVSESARLIVECQV